ncbi:inactive protein RESTRICTED TEV MOVEMENT 2-like [Pyrus ussuriensis x Pyrus communis]|uniref:Inactive protein RESTRICTED TEV MOVEMENT 2-like n=1 Tax=Pyrus ussuriensis x Pyrus communis TaxID=2448454 RepID=A0A5N5GI54_9ROSA|nr:inactive protein RESTRICTED TEV MOVEMENT 2-like [Pyrus ussuriensis x Pyrus communis]
MEVKPNSATINRVYEDIKPSEEWAREEACDTLLVYLQGFRKENLRIQVTFANQNLRVLGERPLGHDNKWQRFYMEFPIPSNCDTNAISAKFENDILYVKLPKLIDLAAVKSNEKPQKPPTTAEAPKPQNHTPTTEAPKPQKPISTGDLPHPQKRTHANQEQNKKHNGGSHVNKSTEKLEEIRAKKAEEDSTKEVYKRAIFRDERNAGGVDMRHRAQGYNYKQVIQGLVMAFVFILVLGLYVKHVSSM